MAVRDHMTRVAKLRARITTVDPSQRIIEAVTTDGGIRRLALFDIPGGFTWPKEGEEWSIYEENGYWVLGKRFESADDVHRVTDLEPGQALVPDQQITAKGHQVTRKYVQLVGDGSAFKIVVPHNLDTMAITVNIRETTPSGTPTLVAKNTQYVEADETSIVVDRPVTTPGTGMWGTEMISWERTWSTRIFPAPPPRMTITRGLGGTTAYRHVLNESILTLPTYDLVFTDIVRIVDENNILLEFDPDESAPTVDQYEVTVVG